MSAVPLRAVIVGGGIIGTWHALEAVRRGWQVVHLERDPTPSLASVRNFGLIWVSGRAAGKELAFALRARELWGQIGPSCPAVGFRDGGSITVATTDAELAALEAAGRLDDGAARGFTLLDGGDARRLCPALSPAVIGALHCSLDALVEPRHAATALRSWLGQIAPDRYSWIPGREVTVVGSRGVADHTGVRHDADLVVFCPGAGDAGVARELLSGAPLQKVALQMFETAGGAVPLEVAVANADSLRYYPAFAGEARSALAPPDALTAEWKMQLLVAPRLDGSLTVGDTHRYDEPPVFDYDPRPEERFYQECRRILTPLAAGVIRRWIGVYVQCTDERLYLRMNPEPNVHVITGAGGRGMTLSPAIAEETFETMGEVRR